MGFQKGKPGAEGFYAGEEVPEEIREARRMHERRQREACASANVERR